MSGSDFVYSLNNRNQRKVDCSTAELFEILKDGANDVNRNLVLVEEKFKNVFELTETLDKKISHNVSSTKKMQGQMIVFQEQANTTYNSINTVISECQGNVEALKDKHLQLRNLIHEILKKNLEDRIIGLEKLWEEHHDNESEKHMSELEDSLDRVKSENRELRKRVSALERKSLEDRVLSPLKQKEWEERLAVLEKLQLYSITSFDPESRGQVEAQKEREPKKQKTPKLVQPRKKSIEIHDLTTPDVVEPPARGRKRTPQGKMKRSTRKDDFEGAKKIISNWIDSVTKNNEVCMMPLRNSIDSLDGMLIDVLYRCRTPAWIEKCLIEEFGVERVNERGPKLKIRRMK
jgi:hypothetical protein